MSAQLIANKYRIVREIARSNDIVYEAVDTTIGRRVALKELLIPATLTGQARRDRIDRFTREARAAGKLSHPNVVTIFDFGEDSGRYFIAMEFLEGQTLRDALLARGAMPLKEALNIANQVLDALNHAHSNHVIHRDIKPDNVHILPGGLVKLTDFGIARLTEELSLTADGQIFGTPSYMSPEQIEGRNIDNRSDLFSLGVVLYEMLAGRKPFTGDSVVTITYNIMHQEPTPIMGIPVAVEQVIFRALAKDPNRRYASAEQMKHDLIEADALPAVFGNPAGSYITTGYAMPTNPSAYPPGFTPGSMLPQPPQPAPPNPSLPPANAYWQPGQAPPAEPTPFPWNNPGAPPASSPFPFSGGGFGGFRPRRLSLPALSDSQRTFLTMFLISILVAGIIVAGVLTFIKAYQENRIGATTQRAIQAIDRGVKAYQAGDFQAALQLFDQARTSGANENAVKTARHNEVTTLIRLGNEAESNGQYSQAYNDYQQALKLEPNNQAAQDQVNNLYQRLDSGMPPSSGIAPDGNGGGGGSFIQPMIQRATDYLNRGNEYYQMGDTEKARGMWQKAVESAPGSQPAMDAQTYLQQTMPAPHFNGG